MHLKTDCMTAAASGQRERVVQLMLAALSRLARVQPDVPMHKITDDSERTKGSLESSWSCFMSPCGGGVAVEPKEL